jgi:type IV fimbrial biogenesis protein FimT
MASLQRCRSRRTTRRARAGGFTLIELMTVVSILAVIVGAMAPSFQAFIGGQRARGLTYDLTTDLLLARNEALKRNASITITPSAAGWDQGWTVQDLGRNELIDSHSPFGSHLGVIGAPASITFDVNGRVSAPVGQVRMTVTSYSNQRCVQLDPSGRARSLLGACT